MAPVQQPDRARPARPHQKVTEDGRPLREVLSYSRRGTRFTPRQQAGWDAHHADWYAPDEVADRPDFHLRDLFDRGAPLAVEIGCGVGEATAAIATARPDLDIVAFEVWMPGVADTLGHVGAAGADNVRLLSLDAVWSLEHLVEEGELAEVWTFFPDPWHKSRHHKRRLVQPGFAAMLASRMAPGATWRLATDWPDYAEQMVEVLDAEPLLDGGVVERWETRPITRFERKGLAAGRPVTDLAYRRR